MRTQKLLLWSLLCALSFVVALVLLAHPFFARTWLTEAQTLVVEGWMPQAGLAQAAELIQQGQYEQVCVTGTLRPFTYYLLAGDTLVVQLQEPSAGLWEVDVTGLPSAGYSLLVNGERIFADTLSHQHQVNRWSSTVAGLAQLSIIAHGAQVPAQEAPVLFISGSRLAGKNLHSLAPKIRILHADGRSGEGTPTHAHEGARLLQELGIPSALISVVPSWSDRDRTHSGAMAMAHYAKLNDMAGFDVATLGVHARRTWIQHQSALPDVPVGVLALEDPWCGRWTWWMNHYGWHNVLKELIALPSTWQTVTRPIVDP